ncbi:MAG: flagellar biosynthesis protein FlgB [Alphaproteobacteria bacterium]|nr:flagellar biosynthesis protein FlgB [Alphaproteobacteria bacterium]
MDLGNSPFFGVLRTRLDQLAERQRLIAENIANASTPDYVPRDIDARAFQRMLEGQAQIRMARTNAMHMDVSGRSGVETITRPDSETTLDGNAVVLEEQTIRAAETRMAYETALALYQKGLQLVRMASRPPGR